MDHFRYSARRSLLILNVERLGLEFENFVRPEYAAFRFPEIIFIE
jgi:hypothetical protein